ncbi:MAG: hypothetical protein ACRDM7_19430 [Thermoleophilaceae bacterium]
MNLPAIVTPDEGEAARDELLAKENEATRVLAAACAILGDRGTNRPVWYAAMARV